jgi:predicted ATPase
LKFPRGQYQDLNVKLHKPTSAEAPLTIRSLRVQQLRALNDTGCIQLKPLTLLVGKNSVGKSTFARVFPLLRQSSEEKRRAPVLWWGKYVDFGTFDDAVHRGSDQKEISLSFQIVLEHERRNAFYWYGYEDAWDRPLPIADNTEIDIELVFASHEGQTYISRTTFSAAGISCCLRLTQTGRIASIESGNTRWTPSSEITATVATGELVPIPRYARTVKNKDDLPVVRYVNPITAKLAEYLGQFAHKNTSQATLAEIVTRIPFLSPLPVFFKSLSTNGPATWKKSVNSLSPDDSRIQQLRQWLFIHSLPKLCRQLNNELTSFSLGVRYLEPLRATAQRFYRSQELAVDEIDSKGENLAVFIDSMDENELQSFNSWLHQNLGFEVMRSRSGGHISLKARFDGNEEFTNLADTGFGVSQVLPIATQLWSSLSNRIRREQERLTSCFVVEQPELHLHPAYQEKIADLFVAAIEIQRNSKRRFPIIAETHSSSMINRLGELVAEKKISPADVQIVMFEQICSTDPVTVRISEFDDDGILQNWPYGFFASGLSE